MSKVLFELFWTMHRVIVGWRFSLVVHVTERVGLYQRSYSTLGPISAWMGDRLQVGKLSRYVTSHPGQISLAVPLWVGGMTTSLGWKGKHRSVVALAMRHRE